MPSVLAAALQEGGRAWRRATLVPLRLLILVAGLLAVFAALAWNLVTTRELLQSQVEATQFLGLPGWRVTLRPDAAPTRGRVVVLADDPALQAREATHPSLWLLAGVAAIRAPDAAAAQYHGLAFANREAGLPSHDADGSTPCIWLGPRFPPGSEWVIEQRLRCRVMAAPSGWQSLASELEHPTLVVPLAAAALVKGPQWRRAVSTLLMAGHSPCLSEDAGTAIRCDSLAANRSAGAEVGRAMGRWNAWVLPAALLAALLAVLIYVQGLKPVLETEFALRIALGMEEARAAAWLVGAVLAQIAGVLIGLAGAVAVLALGLQTGMARSDVLLCAVWAGACCAIGLPLIVVQAWRARHRSLQRLGRLD